MRRFPGWLAASLLFLLLLFPSPPLSVQGERADGPSVGIEWPFPDDVLAGAVNISGTSSGAQWVNVSIDGGGWNRAQGADRWHYLWNASAYASGPHSLNAMAVNGSQTSEVDSVNVMVNNTPPALLTLTLDLSPRRVLSCETFAAFGQAGFDTGVNASGAPVQLTLGNRTFNATTNRQGVYSADLVAPAAAGQYQLTAFAAASGLTATAGAYLQVDLPNPPDLSISSKDISFSPEQPYSGQEVTVVALVYNLGGTNATLRVNFSTPALPPQEVPAGIPAGGSWNPFVKWSLPAGNHNVTVRLVDIQPSDHSSSNNEATAYLKVFARPDLVMTAFVVSNSRPAPGQNITLQARVSNSGEKEASGTVNFFDGAPPSGTLIGGVPVTVAANASRSVFLEWRAGPAGEHHLYASIVNVTPQEATDDNNQLDRAITVKTEAPPETPPSPLPGFEISLLATALGLSALCRRTFKGRKRRSP